MRKKYLSALLFGALLFASAGTFTSCKDYDDEIENLQGQITANADAIKALQDKIGDGKFLTNVAAEGNGLKITWNDNSTTVIENVINGEAQSGDVVSIDKETGEIIINDEKTGFFASKDGETETPGGEVKLPYVNEEGVLVIFDEKGEEVVTGIRVAPVTAVINEDGSAVLTIIAADGSKQEVKVPSAASMITSIELKETPAGLTIYKAQFSMANVKDWKGKAQLPADKSYIVSTSEIDVRINPVSAPADEVEYYITNTENKSLSKIVLTASHTDIPAGGISSDEIGSRAAHPGNGLFTLAMEQTILSETDGKKLFDTNGEVDKFKDKALAINANNTTRSAYGLTVVESNAAKLTHIQIKELNKDDKDKVALTKTSSVLAVDKGEVYTIEGVEAEALYDVYFEISKKDAENYGVEVDDLARTFKVTKRPDVSTAANPFTLIVHTMDVTGAVSKVTYKIKLSDVISSDVVTYDPITFDLTKLSDADTKNDFFNVDINVLKKTLGETDYKEWYNAVKLTNTAVSFFTNADCTEGEVTLATAKKLTKENLKSDGTTATDAADLANIKFTVAKDETNLQANKQYYAKITFKNGTNVVNHIVVPVKFTAPAVSTMFEVAGGYWNSELNTVTAYFRDYTTKKTEVKLQDYFTKFVDDAVVSGLDKTNKVGDTEKTQDQLFDLAGTNFADQTINFDATNKGIVEGAPANGYGVVTKLTATKDTYAGWTYANKEDKSYSFNIQLLSPIYEGTVNVINGEIELNGNDLEKGAMITDAMIKGEDYNKLVYSLMPNTKGEWDKLQLEKVAFDFTDNKYIKNIEAVKASADKENPVEGHFKVTALPIVKTEETTVKINVTDKWGLTLTKDVKIKLIRNK